MSEPDWRAENAARLSGATLYFRRYSRWSETWDHDHCECCWAKFALPDVVPGALTEGYATGDNRHWLCPTCFHELKETMAWKLAPDSN